MIFCGSPKERSSTTINMKRKPGSPPFRFDYYYPSRFKQFTTEVYNFVFDSLYPVRPWFFTAIFTCVSSYLYVSARSGGTALNAIVTGVFAAILPVVVLRLFLRLFFFRYKRHLFESPDRLSCATRVWNFCHFLLRTYASPRLLTCNSLLPKQSVPFLHRTLFSQCGGFSLQRDCGEVQNLIPRFFSMEGPSLQRRAVLKSWMSRNYVTSSWEQLVCLSRREPLLINTTACFVDFLDTPLLCTQASRAAHIAYLTTLQMLSFGDQSQSPLANGLMYSGYYKRLFATSRVPGREVDSWNPRGYSRHVIVHSKGCFYRMEMFDSKTNKIYSPEQLTDVLDEVLEREDKAADAEMKVAALAHDRRDTWAENRERFFLSNATNARFLEQIESSIFVLILDEADNYGFEGDNERLSNFTRSILTGDGTNRWPDKPINIICSKNGRAGICTEHSFADNSEYTHFIETLFGTDIHFLNYRSRRGERLAKYNPISNLQLAKRISVQIVDGMESEIQRCFGEYSMRADDVDIASMVFGVWGRTRIESKGCSPDAFFQMAIQLAYFKNQGRFVPTYEAIASRFYDYARTETIRTVTHQSSSFVRAMLDKNVSKAERFKLLTSACKKHQYDSQMVMTGGGIDRHLFALSVLSKEMGVESPFLDNYMKRQWVLCITRTPYLTNIMDEDNGTDQERWMGGSFGAVMKDGYGIAYRFIGKESIVFHISSYHSASSTNSNLISELLEDGWMDDP